MIILSVGCFGLGHAKLCDNCVAEPCDQRLLSKKKKKYLKEAPKYVLTKAASKKVGLDETAGVLSSLDCDFHCLSVFRRSH